MARTGVLIVAAGGPASLDDADAFLTALNGVAPSAESSASLRRALLTIGGHSPLPSIAERVAAALERSLNGLPPAPALEDPADSLLPVASVGAGRTDEPVEIPVVAGFIASTPTIADAIGQLHAGGTERVVLLPLSPFDPPSRAAAARAAAQSACTASGIELADAHTYADADPFIRAIAEGSQTAVEEVFPEHRPLLVFVAPALSVGEAAEGGAVGAIEDAVSRIAQEIGMGVADADALEPLVGLRAFGGPGLAAPWMLAYLSDSGTVGPVIGPSVEEAIKAAKACGFGGVGLLPLAYTVDDTPTLYRLDVEAADKVLAADMEYSRAMVLNDDARFVGVLETAIRAVL
jgi:protoheme ferro-lyase